MMRLLIKGNIAQAAEALKEAGVEALSPLRQVSTDYGAPLTVVNVSSVDEGKVLSWYLRDYPPYPIGALMLYSRTELAELI